MKLRDIVTSLIVGVVLAGFGAFYNFHGRLSRLEGKLEDLGDLKVSLSEISQRVFQYPVSNIGGIPILTPTLGKPTGGATAVIDTLEADKPENIQRDQILAVFEPITNKKALVNLVLEGLIRINSITLRSLERSKSRNTDEAKYAATISMKNLTDRDIEFLIPKGQVFENKEPKTGRQNIAAAALNRQVLKAGGSLELKVEAYCISKGLEAPTDDPGNITIFKLSDSDFEGQRELWESVQEKLDKVRSR